MTGAFPAIVSAIKAALAAGTPVSSHIFVNRKRAVGRDSNDAIVVRLDTSPCDQGGIEGAPVDWNTRVAIECYARANGDEAVLQAVHDVAAAAWQRLATDPTLGGIAMGITFDGMEWDFDDTGDFLASQTINLTVLHRTAGGTLENQQ